MVQYDPFAPMLITTDLPTREKTSKTSSGQATPSTFDSPISSNGSGPSWPNLPISRKETPRSHVETGAVHPQLRRLSSSHASNTNHYCSRCHMRRPSQEFLLGLRRDQSPDEETWDGFCPDIAMPNHHSPRPTLHHARRHSGLCPDNIISQVHPDGRSSPTQITAKPQPCRHNSSGYHHDCHCENVTPVENLAERYGMVEEPTEIELKRRSTEQEAMNKVAEIMHQELLADMEARQCRL